MSDQQKEEEQFELPGVDGGTTKAVKQKLTKEQQLAQQNIMLKNVIQGLVVALDKVSRSQSQVLAQIGAINNSLEQILLNLPKLDETK